MRHTVRAFTVFLATVSVGGAFVVVALLFYHPIAERLLAERAAEMDRLLSVMAGSAESGGPAALQRNFAEWSRAVAGDYRLSLIGSGGELLADSLPPQDSQRADANARDRRPEVLAALETGSGLSLRYSETAGRNYLYAARRLDGGNGAMALRLGAPYSLMGGLQGDIVEKFALAACVAIVFALVFSWVSTMELKGDLKRVNELARDLAEGRPARPIPRLPKNDLGDLGLALSRLAERISKGDRV